MRENERLGESRMLGWTSNLEIECSQCSCLCYSDNAAFVSSSSHPSFCSGGPLDILSPAKVSYVDFQISSCIWNRFILVHMIQSGS